MPNLTSRAAALSFAAACLAACLAGPAAAFEIWPGDPRYPASAPDARALPSQYAASRPGLVGNPRAFPVRRAARPAQRSAAAPSAAKLGPDAAGKNDSATAAPTSPDKAKAGGPKEIWTSGSTDGRACIRSRRKLWQGDEGWVVKNVTVCP